jgi:hypothetical protein
MADRQMSRGDTLLFTLQVLQPPPLPPSTPSDGIQLPTNITGYTMWFTVKYYVTQPDSQAVWQSGNVLPLTGIIFTQPLSGIAQVTMPPIATRRFPDGPVALVYDVQIKDTAGNIFTVESGTITVNPDVTSAIS